MQKNKPKKIEPIPEQFNSFDELANFWETHDLTDYEDQLHEVSYKVAPKPTRQFVVTLSDVDESHAESCPPRRGFDANIG